MKPTRLTELMQKMEAHSVAVFASAPVAMRNADADYEYRQDSDFYYLTQLDEPESVVVITPEHPEHKYVLFVRPRDREKEIWTGLRTGVEGAVADYGAEAAFEISKLDEELPKYLQDRSKLYYRF